MRRKTIILITAAVLILSLLCSCGTQPSSVSGTPSSEAPGSVPPSSATEGGSPSPSPDQMVPQLDNEARFSLFRTFLSDNYQELSDAFFSGISGIGFIDLDLDGGVEMLVFDAGASAAMGLQFFDITDDDSVECVSANMETVGTEFSGDHMSDVVVNASYFDDFRLMQDKNTGDRFFIIQSGNGAADFSYSELIRFGNADGVLSLDSLMYKFEEYDIDTGETLNESFRLGKKNADKPEYEAAYSAFFGENEDLGYEAAGCFLWENADYGDGMDGLLAMEEDARLKYCDNSYLIT